MDPIVYMTDQSKLPSPISRGLLMEMCIQVVIVTGHRCWVKIEAGKYWLRCAVVAPFVGFK